MSTLPPDSPTPPSESHGEQVPRRVSAETALQFLVASKASSEGATDLVSLARLVAETFNVTSAVLVRRQGRLPLAAWSRGQPHLPPAPVPHGTLLDLVFDRGLYHRPRDADTKAEDVWPRLLGRCGFLGMALKSAAGEVLGAIVLYDDGPLEVGPSDLALLDVFTLRAVAALERSEPVRSLTRDFLLNLLDNLQVPILIKDGQHRYVSMNDAFCRFMDRDRATLLHKSDADFMSPQDARIFQGYDEQVFSSGKPHEYEAAFTDRVTGERIGGMGAVLRGRAGAEESRRAADGSPPGYAPGRCGERAASWRHTSAQAAPPPGRTQQGRGLVGQRDCFGLNTTPTAVAPAPGPAEQATRAAPSAPEWRAPHQEPSGTPAPAACPHTSGK